MAREAGRWEARGHTGASTSRLMANDSPSIATRASGGDNWSFDLAQGRMQRLTFDTTQDNSSPLWSPDGTRIAFASFRAQQVGALRKKRGRDGHGGVDRRVRGPEGTDELVT